MEDLILVTERRLSYAITQLWAKIKLTFAPKSHTHTTNEVKMQNDQTKTLTTELTELRKLAYAGL